MNILESHDGEELCENYDEILRNQLGGPDGPEAADLCSTKELTDGSPDSSPFNPRIRTASGAPEIDRGFQDAARKLSE